MLSFKVSGANPGKRKEGIVAQIFPAGQKVRCMFPSHGGGGSTMRVIKLPNGSRTPEPGFTPMEYTPGDLFRRIITVVAQAPQNCHECQTVPGAAPPHLEFKVRFVSRHIGQGVLGKETLRIEETAVDDPVSLFLSGGAADKGPDTGEGTEFDVAFKQIGYKKGCDDYAKESSWHY